MPAGTFADIWHGCWYSSILAGAGCCFTGTRPSMAGTVAWLLALSPLLRSPCHQAKFWNLFWSCFLKLWCLIDAPVGYVAWVGWSCFLCWAWFWSLCLLSLILILISLCRFWVLSGFCFGGSTCQNKRFGIRFNRESKREIYMSVSLWLWVLLSVRLNPKHGWVLFFTLSANWFEKLPKFGLILEGSVTAWE